MQTKAAKRILRIIIGIGVAVTALTQWFGHPEHLLAYIGTGLAFVAVIFYLLLIVEEDTHQTRTPPKDGPP